MSRWLANKNVRIAALVVGGVVAVLLVFCLGVLVGSRVFRPFGRGSPLRLFAPVLGHGAVGTVSTIQGNTITMMDATGELQTISVISSTGIEIGTRRHAQIQDIHVGDRIVVIGSPQNNTIQARFIRVFRAQPQSLRLHTIARFFAFFLPTLF